MGKKEGNQDAEEVLVTASGVTTVERVGSFFSQICYKFGYGWSTSAPEHNLFGEAVNIQSLSTVVGCGGAPLASLRSGLSASLFVHASSLPHLAPFLRQCSLERLPCVIHVSAAELKQNLSAYTDFTNVLLSSTLGPACIFSGSAQECHDMSIAAYLLAHRANIPVIHFFDGVRTANEVSRVTMTEGSLRSSVADVLRSSPQPPAPLRLVPTLLLEAFQLLHGVVKKQYRLFEYSGSAIAEDVVVVIGGQSDRETVVREVESVVRDGVLVGALTVRLLRPWSPKHLAEVLPRTTKRIALVLTADSPSARLVLNDIQASLFANNFNSQVIEVRVTGDGRLPLSLSGVLQAIQSQAGNRLTLKRSLPKEISGEQWIGSKVLIWDAASDAAALTQAGLQLAKLIGDNTETSVHAMQSFDTYAIRGAVMETSIHLSSHSSQSPPTHLLPADLVVVHNSAVLAHIDISAQLHNGGSVLLLSNAKSWAGVQSEGLLQPSVVARLIAKGAQLHLLDAVGVAESTTLLPAVVQIATLALAKLWKPTEVTKQLELLSPPFERAYSLQQKSFFELVQKVVQAVTPVEIAATPLETAVTPVSTAAEPKQIEQELQPTIGTPSARPYLAAPVAGPVSVVSGGRGLAVVAQKLLFADAFDLALRQRPHEHEQVFLVKVTENRRLTPVDYERNVFHIEMDTTGTGLKYEIGEALGVYGHNDSDEVEAFMKEFNIDPNAAVVRHSTDFPAPQLRTARQILTQELDIFGRPSRRFYGALAALATSSSEKRKLDWLASPEGGPEFKKRVALTLTHADLLREFTSAAKNVDLATLIDIIPPIKPRHYSIASSMKMHPNSVHLLVVLVSWQSKDGVVRYGQCTRYLCGLKAGATVSVSVKPSVMKLPDNPAAPVIMAGLGTGMAPFRAFIQERAWQRSHNITPGPMVVYFGSRSQWEEYLYGEELEAYQDAGILTALRNAFSRDQPHKVYIQHKMQEDSQLLHDLLLSGNGSFYLCGPTWPAADVQDAIEHSFKLFAGMSASEAKAKVAALKEEHRYVLEVY